MNRICSTCFSAPWKRWKEEDTKGSLPQASASHRAERLGDEQPALIGAEQERDAAELDHLIERSGHGWAGA